MYCWKCGAKISDRSAFCPSCGARSGPAKPEPVAGPGKDERNKPLKKRKVKKIVLIASLCAAAALLSVIIIMVLRSNLYDHAVEIMASDPLKAKSEFQSLGSYKDSEDNAGLCQKIYDYGAATDMMDSGDYEGALNIFKQLGGYKDSRSNAEECQNELDYAAASEKMDSGDMQGALEIFLELGGYSDSAGKARECQNLLDYNKASRLMAAKDFSGAYDIFIELEGYKDSTQLAMECGNKRDYALAGQYFDAGKYYSAYKLYTGLGDYLDSAQRAAACAQDYPKTGRLYYDPDYSHDNTLVIKAPKDGYYTYIKIYTYDLSIALYHPEDADIVVSAVFLAPGKTVKIKLAELNFYTVKQAYGTTWYGPDEMFGDAGTYSVMMFENDNGAYDDKFWSDFSEYYDEYYVYTLKLRQSSGNVDGVNIDPNEF